jgi:hypothetical protein
MIFRTAIEGQMSGNSPGADQGRLQADEDDALELAMAEVPKGAIAVAGTAVALLMICWFAIYLFVFLPRGSVG